MPLLEVIAASLDDALEAEDGGAGRLEVVAALGRGGLTPSLAVLDTILSRVRIPVRVMVRESESHVVSDGRVREALLAAAHAMGQRPVDGIVFGALTGDGRIDEPLLDELAEVAGTRVTFHRAIEDVRDLEVALAVLGKRPFVDRVLYNGGPGSWPDRAARLTRLGALAGPSLRFIVGGGVTGDALPVLATLPIPVDVHVGRLVRRPATDAGRVSAPLVAAIVAQLRGTSA
ncbi:MAG TPA: copper homeostasis protein CutC [Vicinamibacterales bacterium]